MEGGADGFSSFSTGTCFQHGEHGGNTDGGNDEIVFAGFTDNLKRKLYVFF